MSLFNKDLNAEEILGNYLDKQYASANLDFVRNKNKNLQFVGVDFILTDKNHSSFKVDEKAQLHYINKDLPTFALEISYIKDNEIKSGWLYDSSKITEIYAFIFSIHLFPDLSELTQSDNIKSCEVVFVNRIRLINELALLGIDLKLCQAQSEILRNNNEIQKLNHKSGFNFQISNHLAEKPVNLIVKKSFLVEIGKHLFFP